MIADRQSDGRRMLGSRYWLINRQELFCTDSQYELILPHLWTTRLIFT